ncbi:hypothetical protein C0991_002414 [Blastosporella zonata]|nr:hypothetical protein C0991_002414 [Blastosporella zonata]
MKPQFLCVEIPKRRPFQGSAPPPSPSPTKKRKLNLTNSPTVSDFEGANNTLRLSPTVSDFENAPNGLRGSPTVSDFDVGTKTFVPSHDDRSSPVASGSNVRLGDLSLPEDGSSPVASGSNVRLGDLSLPEGLSLYESSVDEILEDQDLIVPGETLLDELDTLVNQNDVPVRVLDDFVVFELSSNQLVSIAELLDEGSSGKFAASGLVRAWTDDDEVDVDDNEEDEEDEGNRDRRIQLSAILEFNFHSIIEATGDPDPKMYIRTSYAWYILAFPTEQYRSFFFPFWIKHRVLHSLINVVLREPRTSYVEFLQSLSDVEGDMSAGDDAIAASQMLGRVLTEADIQSEDVKAYVTAYFPDMCEDYNISLKKVVLSTDYLDFNLDDYIPRSPSNIKHKKLASDKEQEVLKHRRTTYVTPIVSQIMKNLFSIPLDVAETMTIEDDFDVIAEIDNLKAHHENPISIKWGGPPVIEKGLKVFASVIMDGVTYCVGDNVMVVPGDDDDVARAKNSEMDASQSPNTYANRLWFCKICYFFEELEGGKKVKMFHGQWFIHGSKTILQEIAHSKSLFLLKSCEKSIPAASIYKKCNIKMMGPEETELPDDGVQDSNDFHCALAYDEKEASFSDLPSDEEMGELLGNDNCISCAWKNREEELGTAMSIPTGYKQHGIKYHLNDFVFLCRDDQTTGVLEIAQIIKIQQLPDNFHIKVQMLDRGNKRTRSGLRLPKDERRVYLTDRKSTVKPSEVDGICHVRVLTDINMINEWVRHDDHFYVNERINSETGELSPIKKGSVSRCVPCDEERKKNREEEEKLSTMYDPIRCLELFSGAGGLGTGLDMSGFVKTTHAVEFSPSAAATYTYNHPDATVYCQDSNNLLRQAYELSKGETPKPLKCGIDGKDLPMMPRRGEVDMISGENVVGLLRHRLMSTRSTTKRSLVGGIEAGMVKFIMRTLIALGYQVRCKVLQAGQYGAPQSRSRIIFWGAKRGVKLPDFPLPVCAFERTINRQYLPTCVMEPITRSLDPDIKHQCAPLPAVTVNDAVGDLPPFDWVNPHRIISATSKHKKELKERIANGIRQFPAIVGNEGKQRKDAIPAGFIDGVDYHTEPETRYQQWMRRGMGDDEQVKGHYTRCFTANVVEATTLVPLRPKATHRDIPSALGFGARKSKKSLEKNSYYGRLDGDEQFKCAMTKVAPNSKESWILHPNQKRIMSVRELARAQGFPDHYIFSEDTSHRKTVLNQIRQIGNAVPVPLALHLGKSLGKALLQDWAKDRERRQREGSLEIM